MARGECLGLRIPIDYQTITFVGPSIEILRNQQNFLVVEGLVLPQVMGPNEDPE